MTEHPPEPPAVAVEDVDRLAAWLDDWAAWLRAEQAEAARHGHRTSDDDRARSALPADAALLLREAYDRT